MQNNKKPAIIRHAPREGLVPLVGQSGRLYGYLDPAAKTIEFKRGGQEAERVDLKPLLEQRADP